MNVESKYDIGDVLWFISNNVVSSRKVTGVFIEILPPKSKPSISYSLQHGDVKYPEDQLFTSKKSLLDTL